MPTSLELDNMENEVVEHFVGFSMGRQELEKQRQKEMERKNQLHKFMKGN